MRARQWISEEANTGRGIKKQEYYSLGRSENV
jgi:hypothetical protein